MWVCTVHTAVVTMSNTHQCSQSSHTTKHSLSPSRRGVVSIPNTIYGPYILVSRCLATKISKSYSRLREGCGLVESSSMMRGEQQLTSFLQPLIWGAYDHASHEHQISGCNYYCTYMYMHICWISLGNWHV